MVDTIKESRDYLEMAFRSVYCFADDGKLLIDELEELISIATRDGVVDSNEQRVLRNIFSRLSPAELTPEMLERIQQLRLEYKI